MKATSTFEKISQHLNDVTSTQIGKCQKVWHNGEDYFLVESETDDLVEYEVHYDETHGFTCNCKAGEVGFSRITVHPSGVCKHVRWACACELEMRTALAEMAEKIEADRGTGRATHALAMPAVMSIEKKWNIPAWMLNAPVARSMKNSPKELN